MIIYNDKLNPALWNDDNTLKNEVRNKLIEIYETFITKLKDNEIPINVIDVLLLGSNAAFNYTSTSDIDLHIVVDFDDLPINNTLTQIFYNNEKSKFNEDHNITIKGFPVEVYIEDINAGTESKGIFSIIKNEWLRFPEYNPPKDVDYSKLLNVYNNKIQKAISSNNSNDIKNLINEIRMMRKISLMEDGEYSKGNLVFKELRNNGSIDSLYNKLHELVSKELSLENFDLNTDCKNGKYYVACKSNFSNIRSSCKDENGKVLYFASETEAKEYAEECRNRIGINYHYWVEKF